MTEVAILNIIREKKRMSYALIAEKLGYKGRSAACNRFNSDSMTVATLVKLLSAMDCELVIKDKAGSKESYVVTNEGR